MLFTDAKTELHCITYLPTVQGFALRYRDFSDLVVLYRELLHLNRDLSLEKINDCESNKVKKCLHS